jgi:tetratricopeptide (TPR) repeat protein
VRLKISLTLWAGLAVTAIVLAVASCADPFAGLPTAGTGAAAAGDGRCPDIAGDWQSWASFLFGEGDTTIKSDGTLVHRSGMSGVWTCQGDKVLMSWWGETPKTFTLQGNRLVNTADGVTGYTRTEAQVRATPPATAGVPERRPAAGPQPSPPAAASGFDARVATYGGDRVAFSADSDPNSDVVVCSNGSGERAIAACTRVIDDGELTEAMRAASLQARGEHYGARGRLDLAVRDLDRAIRAVPDSGILYNSRGLTYGMMGDYDRAIGDFAKAIELIPDFAAAYYNRGQTYVGKQAYDPALSDFTRAIALNPAYTLAYDKRAYVYLERKDTARAIADCTQAIRLSPDYAAAYDHRGSAYAAQGDYDRALGDYSKAIELAPESADFHYSRAALLALRANDDQAMADLDEAIGLAPQRADVHLLRANAWIGKGDIDAAQREFDQAIALDPRNEADVAAFAWSMKGQLKYLDGDPAAATPDYDQAVRLDPHAAAFYIARGMTWDARGESNRAIRDYTQALALQPDAKSARLARGTAYFALGEFGLASEDFAPLKDDPAELHGALWSYLAAARSDGARPGAAESRSELARAIARRKPDAWPAPLFQLFLGQRDAGSLDAAAANSQQRCEAQFYAGEWHLLRGPEGRAAATQALSAAAKSCAHISVEYQTAVAELKRLPRPQGAAVQP